MNDTIRDLNKIDDTLIRVVRELRNIGEGVQRDFYNIGNDACARKIFEVANDYNEVRRILYEINISDIKE